MLQKLKSDPQYIGESFFFLFRRNQFGFFAFVGGNDTINAKFAEIVIHNMRIMKKTDTNYISPRLKVFAVEFNVPILNSSLNASTGDIDRDDDLEDNPFFRQ